MYNSVVSDKTSRGITQNQRGKWAMSSGRSSNETCKSDPTLAHLAIASATVLHERGTKQNSEKYKREAWARMSSTM